MIGIFDVFGQRVAECTRMGSLDDGSRRKKTKHLPQQNYLLELLWLISLFL